MAGRSSILRIGKPARAALLASVLALVNADALTQGAPPITLPATPPPTACTVEPLSVDELRALYDAVLATSSADATAAATPSEAAAFALPAGAPADPATVAAIVETEYLAMACLNAGDLLAQQALFTEESLLEQIATYRVAFATAGEEAFDQLFAALAATPVAAPRDQWGTLVAVRDARVLPDGRVGAVVETAVAPAADGVGTRQDWVVYARGGGQLLVDEFVVGIRGEGISGMATPAP